MIGKPVDFEVRFKHGMRRTIMAVEVANVNTTQLVGETCRLYYDTCPTKLLILRDRNIPPNGKSQCEVLLRRLYGQDAIEHTLARVELFSDDAAIEKALTDLLLLE
jgi:hypothetical protein